MKQACAALIALVVCCLGNAEFAAAQDGAALYANDCADCHGSLAGSDVRNRSAAQIRTAINNDAGGMGYLSALSTADVAAIAAALNPVPTVTTTGQLTAKPGTSLTVTTAAGAVSTLKAKAAALADLLVGQKAVVVTELGIATTLSAT